MPIPKSCTELGRVNNLRSTKGKPRLYGVKKAKGETETIREARISKKKGIWSVLTKRQILTWFA